jgi:hypothetical protein
LSEDDFIDELNGICSDAGRDLRRLDASDRNFFDDALEILQTGADDLAELKPPSDLEDDFNDFSDNLDDQIKATEDLRDAVDDEDEEAIADASGELADLAADGNDLADSLGADDCVDVGGGVEGTDDTTVDTTDDSTGDTTDETTPNTPLPIDTTVETSPPITDPPATTAPATTAPATTAPPMTVPTGTGDGLAQDASLAWNPPDGYVWEPLDDLAGVGTPYGDPVLGSVLTGYWAGLITNPTSGQQALVYFSEVSAEWTPEQLEAIFAFEGVSGGTDITTPLGLPGRTSLGVGDEGQFDVGLIYLSTNTVSIITPAGSDVVGILDGLFTANSMGG